MVIIRRMWTYERRRLSPESAQCACCTQSAWVGVVEAAISKTSSSVRGGQQFWTKTLLLHIIPAYNKNLPQTPSVASAGTHCGNNTTIQQRVFASQNKVRKRWVLWVLRSEQQCNNHEITLKAHGRMDGYFSSPKSKPRCI